MFWLVWVHIFNDSVLIWYIHLDVLLSFYLHNFAQTVWLCLKYWWLAGVLLNCYHFVGKKESDLDYMVKFITKPQQIKLQAAFIHNCFHTFDLSYFITPNKIWTFYPNELRSTWIKENLPLWRLHKAITLFPEFCPLQDKIQQDVNERKTK